MELIITRQMYFFSKKSKDKSLIFTYEPTRDEFGKFNGCTYFAKSK
jgi:hypothetical protein